MTELESRGLLILGAGGHAAVAAEIFSSSSDSGGRCNLLGFLDDDPALKGTRLAGKMVLGPISKLAEIPHDLVFIAIGSNRVRKRIFEELRQNGEVFANMIHGSAVLAGDVRLGMGVMIGPGVIVNPGTEIGDNVIINTAATIDHHNCLGDHVHIAPGVHLGGDVSIGEGSLVGIGSIVIPQQSVGVWSLVGAGAVVIEQVGDEELVAGVPARLIRKLSELK